MKRFFYGLLACCVALESCDRHTHAHDEAHEHEHMEKETEAHKGHAHGTEICKDEAAIAGIAVSTVHSGEFRQTIEVSGSLQFAQTDEFVVTANTAGIVSFTRTFTDGTAVAKGAPLCRISMDRMSGGDPVKKGEVSYKIAKDELTRMERLLKEQIVTQSEYNQALEQYENSRIAYEATREAKSQEGHLVKSPITGYAMETLVKNGDYVNVGTPLIRLVRDNKMMLLADVPLRHQAALGKVTSASFVPEGSSVVFHTDSLSGRQLPCATGISPASAYITLRWEMNRKPGLWSGSFAKVYLHTDVIPDAITVPLSAITDEAGTHYVYLQHDDTHYVKRRVELGASDGSRVQILSGIADGEKVVTTGAMSVRQAGMSKVIGGHGHSH